MTTGPRVDVIKDHSTFFWRYAFLTGSSHAFPEQLSSYHSKGLGSTDDLSSLLHILWEFFLEDVRNVGHFLVGSNGQNLHDHVDHGWTSTLVGSVALLGCGGSSVKGSS